MVPPVALQVTAVLAAPVTVAVNCQVPPVERLAPAGERVTLTIGAATVTVVVAETDPAALVAVSV